MVSGEQVIVNQLCKLVEEFTEVKKLLRASEDRIIDVFYVTVPEAGGTRSLSVGITKINFKTGVITNPDGTVETLTRRLDLTQDKDFMHSISIHSNYDVKFRLDSAGQQTIDAQFLFQLPYVTYTTLEIECTIETDISIFACTNPQATLGNFKVSDMTQQTILGDGVELDTYDSITSLLSNLNRIRYQIKILSGEANWDDVPDTDLSLIDTIVSTHEALSTNVHGVGVGNSVASDDDIATHGADTSVHGVAEVADKATVTAEIDADIATHEADASAHEIAEVRTNVALNSFRIAVNGSLTRFNLLDGVIDDFQDDSGILSGGNVAGGILTTHLEVTYIGTPSASSVHAGFPASLSFDNDDGTKWITDSTNTGWLQYEFTTPPTLHGMGIKHRTDEPTQRPVNYTVLGSNTGAFGGEETTLLTITGESFSASEITHTFDSVSNFKYIRINTTLNGGDAYVSITEFNLYEGVPVISNSVSAETQPTNIHTVILSDVTAITLNTELKFYISVDDGATWEHVTLEDSGDYSATAKILTGSVVVVGTGTTIKYKIECERLHFEFYAVGLLWD